MITESWNEMFAYDDSAEDASPIVALLDAETDDAEALVEAWFAWETTFDDADVVLRLWDYVDRDFRELIFMFVDEQFAECVDDGYELDENPWAELLAALKASNVDNSLLL